MGCCLVAGLLVWVGGAVIIEDLFWRYDPGVSRLPEGLQGVVDGVVLPSGWWLSDVRFVGVVGSVGVLFELPSSPGAGGGAGVAVLVVQNVSYLAAPAVRGPVTGWQVHVDEAVGRWGLWECRLGVGGGVVEIVGTRAILFAGRVEDRRRLVPDGDAVGLLRAGLPSWGSTFVMTMEPGCSDAGIAKGYAQWERGPSD